MPAQTMEFYYHLESVFFFFSFFILFYELESIFFGILIYGSVLPHF